MSADLLERRILGALRFVHGVSGAPLARVLVLRAPGVAWQRNRQGEYLITAVPGLSEHTTAFLAPPATPPIGSVSVTVDVVDPLGEFLPRRVQLRLPRDPDPARADQPDSLFRALTVALFPAPAAKIMTAIKRAVRLPWGRWPVSTSCAAADMRRSPTCRWPRA